MPHRESIEMDDIGLVGLGMIGDTLARRLVKCGDRPVVFDVRDEAVQSAVEAGAAAADSSRELASRCRFIIVCVQNDEQCIAAVTGDDGVLAGAHPGSCIAILSTVLPATIQTLAAAAAERDVDLVDTPVAGRGMFSVEQGSMAVLVGDDGPLIERIEPYLKRFASDIIAAGPRGSGAALKLAHNVVVYAGFAATIEAVELSRAAGVKDGLLEKVARTSGALSDLSGFHLSYYTHLRDDPHSDYEERMLHIAAQLLEKDLADALTLADSHGLTLPIARLLSHSGGKVFQVEDGLP